MSAAEQHLIERLEKENEDLARRLIDISYSAMTRVTEIYKRVQRSDYQELQKLKLLEQTCQCLEILHMGGPL
jgi:uncharacterized protein (DUF39 family)